MEDRDPTEQQRFRRVRRVIEEALSLPSEQRQRFVDDCCAEDPDLARDVRALLAREEQEAPLLDGKPPGRVSLSAGLFSTAAWARSVGCT